MSLNSTVERPLAAIARWPRLASWIGDLIFTFCAAAIVASILGVAFLNSSNWPTGGDAASHLLYAWLYADELLFSGQILPWVPEVFGGLPFLSYYFPLPFIVIAVLSKWIGLASAFKWGAFLPAMLIPGAIFACSRRWLGFSWPAALFAALGAMGFLLHEQNSIWGGNLLSTLSGEFAYGYGLMFAVLAMMAWSRALHLGRGWVMAALFEAASGFSHGFPLLIVGFSTMFLLLDGAFSGDLRHNLRKFGSSVGILLRGHLLAFMLLGGWLWPMIEMHGLTIPNDSSYPIGEWRDLLPATLWPSAAGGLLGLLLMVFPSVRRGWGAQQRSAVCYFVSAAGMAAVAFIAGDQLGLADIRFFPLVWLLGAIACGWLAGQAFAFFGSTAASHGSRLPALARLMFAVAACLSLFGWFGEHVQRAPDWALWNHAGLDAKPQWHNLSKLFPAMKGDLWSPRLLFEHDPANNDLGSTRSLEALPMFINHRPVLEGLYMETALLGPAIYQLQSEVSAQPSSPLVRFPSGSLDPQFAAWHMNFLHADTLLLRSVKAKAEIEASGLFTRIAEAPPFALYRLKQFDSQLAKVVTQPLRALPRQDWMQDAFTWFRSRSHFGAYLPVYGESADEIVRQQGESINAAAGKAAAPAAQLVWVKHLSRDEMVFETTAIGKPHLIKIAYHPRWQLESKGSMQLAGPGFMLVVPREKEIRLAYGHTAVGKAGVAATVLAAFYLLFLAFRRFTQSMVSPVPSGDARPGLRYWATLCAGWLLLAVAGLYFASHSPERVYQQAWQEMNGQHFKEASERFLLAYQWRHPPAKKEEALFWLAKSNEQGGQRAEAKSRYRELCETYHGYWVPESLYTLALLEREDGHAAEAAPYLKRLREEYPNNSWTLKLDSSR